MSLTLEWIKDLQFAASDDKGHGIVVESRQEGTPSGFTPMQLMLIAQAGCMAMDVVSILKKKRLDLSGFRVLMEGVRAEEHPRRFTEMSFVFEVQGNVSKKILEEALKLSEDKYCSVSSTIKHGARMNIQSRVVS